MGKKQKEEFVREMGDGKGYRWQLQKKKEENRVL